MNSKFALKRTVLMDRFEHKEGTSGGGTATLDAKEVKTQLDRISDQVKEAGEKAIAEAKKGVTLSEQTKADLDKLLTEFNKTKASLTDLEQKAIQGFGAGGAAAQKSMGEVIVESAGYKRVKENGGRGIFSVEVERKVVSSASAGTGLIRPLRENDIVDIPRRRFTIRDLIPTVPIATSSVEYAKQLARTNNAAPVAEAAAKPYSDYTWTMATVAVRTIAHLAKLTRQAIDDAPRLVGEVDSEMRYGLGLVEEAQILSGDGTGQNLFGIIPQATVYVAPAGAPVVPAGARVDRLRLAMLQASLSLFPADGVVMSQNDWAYIEMAKTTDGAYLMANPAAGNMQRRMWGLPVVDTPAMAINKFLVGNFTIGATLYDRMGVEVLISTENVDDFEKNLATMRAEERLALAVKRPAAFVYGDFSVA